MTIAALRAVFGALLSLAAIGAADAQGQVGTYTDKGPTPQMRSEVAAVEMGGKIYVVGGEIGDIKAATLLQEYDPAKGTWRDLAEMPAGTSHPGAAILNGKLYVAGGFTKNVHLNPIDRFFAYDFKSNSWQTLPPLAAPLGSVGMAAVAGKIHVIGGRGPDQIVVTTHQVFDPIAGTWSNAAPLPVARDHFYIGVLDGKIHVVGGRGSGTGFGMNTNEHDVFDPATGAWTMAAPLPTARSGGAAAVYRGLLFTIGGECKDPKTRTAFNEIEAYDAKRDAWTIASTMPQGWHAFGAAAAGNALYMIGGSHGCGGAMPATNVTAFTLP